ncbi:site-specific DNA-methyltransferase [Microbacterium sp. AG790]|uniref:site-specific DNA-methyltransferase n=1 Tax=Microbacterium sp. AG790 TaxID=2183995 RepID=UPI00217EF01D|nr:site-specific DNA-methyltransferase [Microbacterium sp. AG790]
MTSPDLTRANIDKIADLFPTVVTETLDADGEPMRTVDFDMLRQELSNYLVDGPQERYQLDWPGKRAAAFAANAPIAKTLRPVREESVDFDTTRNLFIEGDNLDALKMLQESYLGRVKLIYIDPPYNTGNDFVYEDDFAESSADYLARSGQKSESGERLIANTESNGRFHSDWLSMMYPRLKLARNLLSSDGFIVVSIDDAEVSALELLLDEVMGAENKLAVLVWDRNRKNDARYFSVGHEYMLVYARDREVLQESGLRLREPQAGLEEAQVAFAEMQARHGVDWAAIQAEWRKWTASFAASDERRKLGRFTKVGPRGPFRDDGDISWPGGGGPKYEVLHPVTNRPTKVPAGGWVYPAKSSFDAAVASGRVVFGPDETTLPRQMRYLFDSAGLVMPSVHYSYAQTAAVEFHALMGGRVFDNPKNWKDLRRLIDYLTQPGDLIVDFFAGSASTGHAVFDLNAVKGSDRQFVLVQLDERVSAKSPAAAAGFGSIADIARERLKRAAATYPSGSDLGFRSFRVDTTNMNEHRRAPDDLVQAALIDQTDSVKSDRTDEDLLFQVLLDWGLDLSLPILRETIAETEVYSVDDGALIACFAYAATGAVIRAIAERRPLRAVFRDSGFVDDSARVNAEQIFREVSPETEVRAI